MKALQLLLGIALSKTTLFAAQPPAANRPEFQRQFDRVYVRGLEYLRDHQRPDGTFGQGGQDIYGKNTGVVGLAVIAMLAHEQDPNQGPYAKSIQLGLNFILKHQNLRTGYIGSSMYTHGYATLALAKAKEKVKDPRLKPRLDAALQKAVDLILAAQKRNRQHAWRYSPESTDADVCVTGCILHALFAARESGIKVPQEPIDKGLQFLIRCQGRDGGFGYTSRSGSNLPRTAIAVTMLALNGLQKKTAFHKGMEYLTAKEKEQGALRGHYYYYQIYYASRAMYHGRPEEWQKWNQANFQRLQEAHLANGSWDGTFGPSLTTCFALLSMTPSFKSVVAGDRVVSDMRHVLGKPKGSLTPEDRAAYAKSFATRLRKLAESNERTAGFIKQHMGGLIGTNLKDLPEPSRIKLLEFAREHKQNTQLAWDWRHELERFALAEKKPDWVKLAKQVQQDKPESEQEKIAVMLNRAAILSTFKLCGELAKQYKAWAKELESLGD